MAQQRIWLRFLMRTLRYCLQCVKECWQKICNQVLKLQRPALFFFIFPLSLSLSPTSFLDNKICLFIKSCLPPHPTLPSSLCSCFSQIRGKKKKAGMLSLPLSLSSTSYFDPIIAPPSERETRVSEICIWLTVWGKRHAKVQCARPDVSAINQGQGRERLRNTRYRSSGK